MISDGKKKSRPVRSLTDEEYEEIFNAVLANCHTPGLLVFFSTVIISIALDHIVMVKFCLTIL